ncbi:vomeronasal type-2 receptor 26-like [Pyxicephalus adspersus]|uniref:vomeronasal type-2 receptor 26-like n=1 Tax=Pyxicephalus adspersus TaxID=30357 RepID=UPI003B5A1BBA
MSYCVTVDLRHFEIQPWNVLEQMHGPGTLTLFQAKSWQWLRSQKMPHGRCSDHCLPGSRKAVRQGFHSCCYDCISCFKGEITNLSDSEYCQKCPDDEWPNYAKDKCIKKIYDYFSYEKDTSAICLALFSILFSIIIISIIGLFVYFLDTPIVKANNRNLSFLMLISLKFSLLSVFLFIGHPINVTCMLRQISFGFTFTFVVSSVLAKTILVFLAFKATRPGSIWRKYVGVKLPNAVVLICSSVQVLNGTIWLSFFPPFIEFDMDAYPGKIIIQCNEGSVFAFYFMLGFIGILAFVSFVLAFLVRKLPDMFNEGKYITFSMLVFCSVWICAMPAYLSSKGTDMVTVEIFAIMASSVGVLACIFFPKCYILLLNISNKHMSVKHSLHSFK